MRAGVIATHLLVASPPSSLVRRASVRMGLFDQLPGMPRQASSYAIEDGAPSWEQLRTLSGEKGGESFRTEWDEMARGRGRASHQANLRLFDAPDDFEPRVELFRDTAGWCPYCQKVWCQLEAKRIPYKITKVPMSCYGDKPPWFRAISPSGAIPVAKIDGQIVPESNDIMFALEELFPDHRPLLPPRGSPDEATVRELMGLERSLFSVWFGWLRARADGTGRFEAVMDRVEAELGARGGPYLMGKELSFVDLLFIPFLERMCASLPYYKNLVIRGTGRWPNVERWFQTLEVETDWYAGIKSDYYTHCHDLPPQIGGCAGVPEAAPLAAQIDGLDGRAWSLPLPPSADIVEPISPPVDDAHARVEAAERLLRNHEAVSRFAARGVGQAGFPPVGAPLADPRAKPADAVVPAVDAALRHVVHALVAGPEAARADAQASELPAEEVAKCLAYLRDRVGVPRDMSFPAARQLRAHLNWMSSELTGGKLMY